MQRGEGPNDVKGASLWGGGGGGGGKILIKKNKKN